MKNLHGGDICMIQPLDIKNQTFKKGLFGYKSSEVQSFVDTVYRAYDELYKENAELTKKFENSEKNLQDVRVKVFELENEVQKLENVSSVEDDNLEAKKKADQIIKNAEAAAAEIIAKAKEQSEKIETASAKKEAPAGDTIKMSIKSEPKAEEPAKESASSRFFKKTTEETSVASSDDDDEIFVGEIEDARKPDRMMIGDGEEEADMDFEFL